MNFYTVINIGCFSLMTMVGCAHKPIGATTNYLAKPEAKPAVKIPPLPDQVLLKFVGEMGREELSSNCSVTTTKTFLNDQIQHKRIENLEFKVRTVTLKTLSNGNLIQVMETISKDGTEPLHDFAYPELGETLDMELTPAGEVKRAGKFAKNSIFYVPPLPLPSYSVKIRDYWDIQSSWKSEESELPLTVSIHAQYLGNKVCGEHMCVNIGVEGGVHLPKQMEKKNKFEHRLNGRFLFEPTHGQLVWSEFLSEEHLQSKGARAEVHSLRRSELLSPPGFRTVDHEEPSCPIETKEE